MTLLLKRARLKAAVDTVAANVPITQRRRARILRAKNCFDLSTQEEKGFGWARDFIAAENASTITDTDRTDAASLVRRQPGGPLFAHHFAKSARSWAYHMTQNALARRFVSEITGRVRCVESSA